MSLRAAPSPPHPPPAAPRLRASPTGRRLDRVLGAARSTGCVFSKRLGTASPCGLVLACCDAAGRFDTIAVFTSKTEGALNLDGYTNVDPAQFSDMEKAVLASMRDNLQGPFYHNVFVAPGASLHGGADWTLAERAAVGQIQVMNATPLIGPLLDAKLERAMAPVVAAAQGYFDSERTQLALVPFRQIPGEGFDGALARLQSLL